MCHVTIVNQKPQVDQVYLSVEGIPAEWVEGTSKEIQLQANGGRKEVQLIINVPRNSSARAKDYAVQILAHSTAQKALDQGYAKATWKVLPFDDVKMTVIPPKASGRKSATYNVHLRQDGNTKTTYTLSGASDDDDNPIEFKFAGRFVEQPKLSVDLEPEIKIPPVRMKVKTSRRWVGTSAKRVLTVQATRDGSVLTTDAQFNHLATFPPWVWVVVPALLIGIAFLVFYTFKPQDPEVWTVPPQEQLVEGVPFVLHWDGKTANRIMVRLDGQDLPSVGIRDEYHHPGTTEKTFNVIVQGENFFGKSNPRNATFRLKAPPPKARAVIESFTADPPSITKGNFVTLKWKIRNATRAKVDPGIGIVDPKDGSVPTAPLDMTQQFKLIAYVDDVQSDERTVTVTVGQPAPAVIEFTARDPKRNRVGPMLQINQGDAVEFSWQTRNAKGIQIGAINPLPLSTPEGIRQAIFTGRGVYTLNLIVMDEQGMTQSSKPIQVTVTCGGIKKALVPIGKGCNDKQGIKWQ